MKDLDLDTKRTLDDITRRFFRAFASSDIGHVDLSALQELFVPRAIVIKTCAPNATIYSLKEFIEPRQKLLTDGSVKEFQESEVFERTDIFGHIAQRFCLYQKSWIQDGKTFAQKGMKTIQFIKTADGWKISSVAWDDEREGLTIPERYKNPTQPIRGKP